MKDIHSMATSKLSLNGELKQSRTTNNTLHEELKQARTTNDTLNGELEQYRTTNEELEHARTTNSTLHKNLEQAHTTIKTLCEELEQARITSNTLEVEIEKNKLCGMANLERIGELEKENADMKQEQKKTLISIIAAELKELQNKMGPEEIALAYSQIGANSKQDDKGVTKKTRKRKR